MIYLYRNRQFEVAMGEKSVNDLRHQQGEVALKEREDAQLVRR